MPAHIYHQVGRWIDSLEINREAVAADEAYFERVGIAPESTPGVYTDGYYPHNLHFLMTSAQMAGDVEAIAEAAKKLESLVSDTMARKVAGLQPIKAAPYFAHAQYSDPEVILALPLPATPCLMSRQPGDMRGASPSPQRVRARRRAPRPPQSASSPPRPIFPRRRREDFRRRICWN
ncbi:hypothetical protein [Mesorhizobium sp.]|uniref:hypothetical protein n=1 Tax=Mesorhizobium sp. TaxID=1871066 RepID=UPI0025C3B9C9|nr:hypothetical protein [Mesorhizobium sp.]